jgi:hypothetical protein
MLQNQPNAPSGKYMLSTAHGKLIRVYCEMGLNGGGYTFIDPEELPYLTDYEVQRIFTDKKSFLMRLRKTDGQQPYEVLSQLPEYATVPLMIGLNHNNYYNTPENRNHISNPYLYFGFLPANVANQRNVKQGVMVNNARIEYTNCNGDSNNYIALFPNFKEQMPSNRYFSQSNNFFTHLIGSYKWTPSKRVMPIEFFMFAEIHFGGCGCYAHVENYGGHFISAAIGFR